MIPGDRSSEAEILSFKFDEEEDPETARKRSRIAWRLANLDAEGLDRVEKVLKQYGA